MKLRQHFKCYGIDLRGQGDSQLDVPEDAVSLVTNGQAGSAASKLLPNLEGYIEDITVTLDHLNAKGGHRYSLEGYELYHVGLLRYGRGVCPGIACFLTVCGNA